MTYGDFRYLVKDLAKPSDAVIAVLALFLVFYYAAGIYRDFYAVADRLTP